MEKLHFSRLTAVAYLVSAVFGLIFSLGFLIGLWATKPQVTESIEGTLALVGRSLTATTQTLVVVNHSLDQASTNLDLIHTTMKDISKAMQESNGMVKDTASLMGTNMVGIVHQTQSSLQSAGSNLKVVDDTLHLISRIPFIGANYQPGVPLQESFNQVSKSLDPLPDSFNKISAQLNTSASNITRVQSEVDTMAAQIEDIKTSITDARDVAGEYANIIKDLQSRYDHFQQRLPVYLNVFYIGFTGILVWMLMAQLAMLIHGFDMLR